MKLLKKAELSINMIVIVAICIIVLVIIVFLVINQARQAEKATACTSLGGVCTEFCRVPSLSSDPSVCSSPQRSVCCPPLEVIR